MTSRAQEQVQAKTVAVVIVVVIVSLNNLTYEIDGEEGLKLAKYVSTLLRWTDDLSMTSQVIITSQVGIIFNDFPI